MKIISYKAVIKQVNGNKIWTEIFTDLVVDDMTSLRHCSFLIQSFNDSLRKGELPRKLISVRDLKPKLVRKHNWVREKGRTKGKYLKYRCSICNATGKRYGKIEFVTPDRKFTIYCK